jgi:uncharacterized repeat protein (TIGR01451 family)
MSQLPSDGVSRFARTLVVGALLASLAFGSATTADAATPKPLTTVTFIARACPGLATVPENPLASGVRQAPRCKPLTGWPFTLGGAPASQPVETGSGPLSVLANPIGRPIRTRDRAFLPKLPSGSVKGRTVAGARTIVLPSALVKASAEGDLWVQGGTPSEPVPDGGLLLVTLRCTGTGGRARNVQQLSLSPGGAHLFCFAFYVRRGSGAKGRLRESRAGHPGEPQPPRVVYTEGFENGIARAPTLLSKYTGLPPLSETYTASQRYLENCDGFIVQFESNERKKASDCEEVAFNRVRQLAWVLGQLRGTDPTANHAVSAYTDGGVKTPLPANSVQFETVKPIPLIAASRFITFSVDAAETNCKHNHAEFEFYLLSGSVETPTFTSSIDPCTDKNAKVIEPPVLGTKASEPFKAGSFTANAATLFSGAGLGIRMRNAQTSEDGNDAAFDNIQVLDATPQLDKSFSPELLNVGETSQLTYTITNTTELGGKSGWGFTDTLPAGLVVATPATGSTTCAAPTTVTASAGGVSIAVSGNLAAEKSYCTVTVDVTSHEKGTYVNGPDNISKEIGIEPPGPATVTFAPNADLEIKKSASPTPGVPGTNETYTLKVTNKGPQEAENAVVSDDLPDGLSFVSGSSSCEAAAGAKVKCALGTLAVGQSVTLTIVAHIAASINAGFVNVADVSSTTPDPDLSNNSDTAAVPIPPAADLEIIKRASSATVTPGGQVSYTLVVNNNGPNDATDVTVKDPLPKALTLTSAKPSQGSCATDHGLLCSLGGLAVGGSAQILLTADVTASAEGILKNTATVTGGQPDPNPDNNSSAETVKIPLSPLQPLTPDPLTPIDVPVQPVSDMKIVKHVDRAAAQVGQQLTYTLRVTNRGPDDAPEVRVVDTWSIDLTVLSAHPSQGHCQLGRPLECSLGPLKRGAGATIRVVATAEHVGKEKNTASVTSTNRDPDPSNNQSSVETGVAAPHRAPPPPTVTG